MVISVIAVTEFSVTKVFKQLLGDPWRTILSQAQNGEKVEVDDS